jgi:hypothetical protein
MVAVAARCDAAHIDGGDARLRGLERHRRQQLGIFVEVRDVELIELARADRLDADRDRLDVLVALLRGDDDLVAIGGQIAGGLRILLLGKGREGQESRGEQPRNHGTAHGYDHCGPQRNINVSKRLCCVAAVVNLPYGWECAIFR